MPRVTELTVNGTRVAVDADAATPLLGVLREQLGLTGSKIGCGEGECGACTVIAGGTAIRACITPVGSVAGRAHPHDRGPGRGRPTCTRCSRPSSTRRRSSAATARPA